MYHRLFFLHNNLIKTHIDTDWDLKHLGSLPLSNKAPGIFTSEEERISVAHKPKETSETINVYQNGILSVLKIATEKNGV